MYVSNSSTLILLAKIDLLGRSLDMLKEIVIPKEVYEEFIKKSDSMDSLLISKEINENRIKVVSTKKEEFKIILDNFRLHQGEAAAYCIYKQGNYMAILTDDKELIKLCRLEKIPFICSLAVVLVLVSKKLITKEQGLSKMEELYVHGRYSKEIYDYYKEKVK